MSDRRAPPAEGIPRAQADDTLLDERGMLVRARKQGLAGQLKHIKLENFMCHEHFSMEFGWVGRWVGRWVGHGVAGTVCVGLGRSRITGITGLDRHP